MNAKRWAVSLLAILLLLPILYVPVLAEEAPEFRYELSVNGEDDIIEVNTGDIITVTLYLYRTDAAVSYTMYGMQDEIRYDSEFFELVEDSAILSSGVSSTDIGVGGGLREFYMNFIDVFGGKNWKSNHRVGSFQLRVIATSGMTTITNEDFKVFYQDGMGSYECQANELTVILNTSCEVRFETNGGTPIDSVSVVYGYPLDPPQATEREGYEFAGWYKDFRLTEPWNFDTDIVERNMRLYAKWEPVETDPPETEPPVTEPPETETETEPPVTEPPVTEPPVTETEPPETDPPETETETDTETETETNPPETETDTESGIEIETKPPEEGSETETKPTDKPGKPTKPDKHCLFCGNAASNYLCARCAIVTWAGLCLLSLMLFAIIMYFYFRFNNKDKKKSPKK